MLNFKNSFLAFFILFISTQAFCPGRKSHNFSRVKLGDLSFLNPRASVSKDSLGRTTDEVKEAVENAGQTLTLIINGCSISPEQKKSLARLVNSDLFLFFYNELFSSVFLSEKFEVVLQNWLCKNFGVCSYLDGRGTVNQYHYRGMLIDGRGLLFYDKTCQKTLMLDFFVALKAHCLKFLHLSFEANCHGCSACSPYKLVHEMTYQILSSLDGLDAQEIPDFKRFGRVDGVIWNTLLASCLLTFLDNAEIEPFIPEKDRKLNWDPSFLDSPMVRILKSDIKFDI